MEKRKPYNLERILLFYNGIQVIANFSILAYVSIDITSSGKNSLEKLGEITSFQQFFFYFKLGDCPN